MPILDHNVFDQTLCEIAKRRQVEHRPAQYSIDIADIGIECDRKLWYRYRQADQEKRSYAEIRDQAYKDFAVNRLVNRFKELPNFEFFDKHPETGNALTCTLFSGHVSGTIDGTMKGLLESPNKWHLWQHLILSQEEIDKIIEIRLAHGEKKALKIWSEARWMQAQSLMQGFNVDRHYLTFSAIGETIAYSLRTDRREKGFEKLLQKADEIMSTHMPKKIECSGCGFAEICENKKPVQRNCGTCQARSVETKGFACFVRGPLDRFEACIDYDVDINFGDQAMIISEFGAQKVEGHDVPDWAKKAEME